MRERDIGLLFIPILLSYRNSYYRILCFPLHLYLVAFEQTRTLLSALTTQKSTVCDCSICIALQTVPQLQTLHCVEQKKKKKKRHQKDPSIDYSGRIKPPGTRQEHFCNWEQAKKARKILPKKADDRDHTVELMPSNPPKTKKKTLQN